MASESLTNTNISETYVGVLHAKGAPIPATGKEDIYDGFGNKSALSIGREGQGIEVDGELGPKFAAAIADVIYPVGSLFFSIDNNNPGSRMTGTTWRQVAEGKFVAGVGTGTDKNGATHTTTAEDTDTVGEYDHTLTEPELPAHTHPIKNSSRKGNDDNINFYGDHGSPSGYPQSSDLLPDNTGSNAPHNNLPPAYGMYVWERIS